jgi:parvulin-like peptidyl-prolyl isomerase
VQQTATTPHPDEPEPVILAQVGRRTLTTTQAEIRGDAMLLFDPSAATGSLGGEFTLAQQAATAWARQTALAEEARSRRISVNDREVSATHQQLLENYGRDPIASLITAGLTQEDALQDLRDRALGEKLVRTIFQTRYPERALRELFDSSPSTFALPPRAKVREIVLPRGQSPEAAERSKEQIHSLWERAKSGNGDFAALAAQHSRSASARDGGLVGWFDQTNPAPPEAARALAGLSAGDITEPFLTEEGWKILQVIEIEAAPTGFAASRALVERTAKAMARDEILKSAWEKHRARAPQHLSSDEEVRLTAFENRPAQPENPPFTALAGHQQQSPAKSTVSAPAPRPRRADSVAANPPATQTNSSTPPPPPTRGRDDRGIGGLLSRLQGQDGSTVSSIPSNPYGINASATVSGRRATGDSIANVAGTVGQMGAQLLDRTRQTVTPSATDMAFIDMNQGQSDQGRQNPEGSSPERNSVRSQSLTDEELTAALRGGPDPRKTATSPDLVPDLSPPNREATANPRTSAQSAPTSAQNSRNRSARDPNIPAGFFPEEPKSVSERAAETAKKPIEAVHGAVSRTLGFFRRDKSDN